MLLPAKKDVGSEFGARAAAVPGVDAADGAETGGGIGHRMEDEGRVLRGFERARERRRRESEAITGWGNKRSAQGRRG